MKKVSQRSELKQVSAFLKKSADLSSVADKLEKTVGTLRDVAEDLKGSIPDLQQFKMANEAKAVWAAYQYISKVTSQNGKLYKFTTTVSEVSHRARLLRLQNLGKPKAEEKQTEQQPPPPAQAPQG